MLENIAKQIGKYRGLTYIIDELNNYQNSLNELYTYGMVLFGPDSFKQTEVFNIIEFLTNKGFKMIAVKIKRVSKTQAENLFLPTSTCMECGSLKWWMIQDSASLGEFASIIFYSPSATLETNCLAQLNKFKGNSDPLKNSDGVVRYDFKAINICLNLIHIPDTYGDFFKDTSPFYTIPELVEIVNRPVDLNTDFKEQFKNDLFLIKLYSRNTSFYEFESLIYKIKYLLADALKISEDSLLSLKTHYIHLYNTFEKADNRAQKREIYVESISKEKNIIYSYQELLIGLMSKNKDHKGKVHELVKAYCICDLLYTITDPYLYKQYNDDFFLQLQALNIYIDAFEKIIVNTSLLQWR